MATRRNTAWPWATCLWPGLPQLWWRGDSLGLAAAVLLAMLVNLCIAASWVWPELLSPNHRMVCWLTAGGIWLACLPWSYWAMRGIVSGGKASETLLIAAQTNYLKGNWVEAESLLKRQLRQEPRDIESRLLLAAVYRRTDRCDQALSQLRRLSRLEESAPWQREIAYEQVRITPHVSPEVAEGEPEENCNEEDQDSAVPPAANRSAA